MVTLTLAHTYGGDWGDTVKALQAAHKLFDRRMGKHYKKVGAVGKFKATEATVGQFGLHPHYHILQTHLKDADLEWLAGKMRIEWKKAVAEVGGSCNDHGFDFKENCINDYAAKMESAHELAAQSTKKGRRKGQTLSQLLDAASRGDLQAGAEWQRSIKALGTARRFQSGKLATNLGIPSPTEWEDEQSEEEKDGDAPVEPVQIFYPLDDHLKATHPALGRPGLAMILRAARRAGENGVLRMVGALCAAYNRKNTYRSLDVGEAWAVEPDIIKKAREGPLSREDIVEYLRVKRGLAPTPGYGENDDIEIDSGVVCEGVDCPF